MKRAVLILAALGAIQAVPPRAASAAELPADVSINGVEFVLIPAGWFRYSVTTGNLGMQPANAPLFRHWRVWLDDYYLAKYEARARDFVRFLNSGSEPAAMMETQQRESARAYTESDTPPDPACAQRKGADGVYRVVDERRDLPATGVSWTLADAFARWMGFRLPSEAEWEKAARGPDPDRRVWPWGDEYPDDTYGAFNLPADCHPSPVTAYPKGRSPYGIYNLAGNVEEHVADWYSAVADGSLKDGALNPAPGTTATPFPGEPPKKITKGGRWSLGPAGLVIADRAFTEVSLTYPRMGVRFALDAATVREHLERGSAVAGNQ